MPLKLLSSGGGSVLLTANTTASDFTVNVPAVNGNMVTTADTGSITQSMLGAGVYAGYGPAFSAYQNSNQSISATTWTKINFQAKEFDTANCFDSTTNYRFTPNVAGYYQFTLGINGLSSTTYGIAIYKNGSIYKTGNFIVTGTIGGPCINMSAFGYANGSTDYYEAYVYAAASASLTSGIPNVYFQGFLARAA